LIFYQELTESFTNENKEWREGKEKLEAKLNQILDAGKSDGDSTEIHHVCDLNFHHKDELEELRQKWEAQFKEKLTYEISNSRLSFFTLISQFFRTEKLDIELNDQNEDERSERIKALTGIIDNLNSTIDSLNARIEELESNTIAELKSKLEQAEKEKIVKYNS